MQESMTLYDFHPEQEPREWSVVDDVVMGGRSNGAFYINDDGNGVFHGKISLKNNGGFSSIRHRFPSKDIHAYRFFRIRLKGDGKKYQFRVRSLPRERHSYVAWFATTRQWQTVDIPIGEMVPRFRGMMLEREPYTGQYLSEIGFLIANGIAESFTLEIDTIYLTP